MAWCSIKNISVDKDKCADGEWTVDENELEIRIMVRSNNRETSFTVAPAVDRDSYRDLAKYGIQALNSIKTVAL